MGVAKRNEAKLALLSVILAVTSVSCARPLGPNEDVSTVGQDVSLRAACAFDAKLEIFCACEELSLQYYGELARVLRPGLQPAFIYNEWCVRLFCADNSKSRGVRLGDRFLPENTRGDIPKGLTERVLFSLRIGHFGKGANIIPIQMGPHKFDVMVFNVEGKKGIDEVLPVLGTTIRKLVKRVEIPLDCLDDNLGLE